MERVATIEGRTIYENRAALPRAYTVSRVRFVPGESEALGALLAPGFDGHQEAVAVGEPVESLVGGVREAFRPARIAVDELERVVIDVDVPRPALLVLADAFAPGWHVMVDGAPRRLWQVNHYVRGVTVGPGDRRAEFSYRPPRLLPGLGLCVIAWGGLGLLAAIDRCRRGGHSAWPSARSRSRDCASGATGVEGAGGARRVTHPLRGAPAGPDARAAGARCARRRASSISPVDSAGAGVSGAALAETYLLAAHDR